MRVGRKGFRVVPTTSRYLSWSPQLLLVLNRPQLHLLMFLAFVDPFSDPFDDKAKDSSSTSKDYVHIRIQQRNGRKSLTTVQVWTMV